MKKKKGTARAVGRIKKSKKKETSLVGFSDGATATFNSLWGTCENKPLLAIQDSTGRIQCMEARSLKEAKRQAEAFRKHGFTVLVGVG